MLFQQPVSPYFPFGQLCFQPGNILSEQTDANRAFQRGDGMRKFQLFQTQFIFLDPRIQICFTQIFQAVYKIDFSLTCILIDNLNYNGNRHIMANYEFGFDRQFLCSQQQCFFSYSFRNTICFKKHTTWFHYGSPVFGVTLTLTHSHFLWFLGNRLIGKNTDPYISFSFHGAGKRLTGSFQLTVG